MLAREVCATSYSPSAVKGARGAEGPPGSPGDPVSIALPLTQLQAAELCVFHELVLPFLPLPSSRDS